MKEGDYGIIEDRHNINVNVFSYENEVHPLYISRKRNEQKLNVLLISNGEKSHYVFIKDFSRLMYQKTKHKERKHFCMHCLQNFTTEEILNSHIEGCLVINDTQAIKYKTEIIKFNNFDKQIPIPFKIYADTECFVKEIDKPISKHTKLYQKHTPNSIGAKLICIDNEFTLPTKIFFGDSCINKFIRWIFIQRKRINQIIDNDLNKKLKMTIEDEEAYQSSNDCWICDKEITKNIVRDHRHITGKYRGPAHRECNLKLRIPRKLPIIFHNLKGYDGHLIFRELSNFNNIDVQVIPKSSEKYMSIIINRNIIFLDSLQFHKASLDTLAGNLQDSDFKHLMSEFLEDKLKIIKKKNAYPFEWVDSYIKNFLSNITT